MKNKLSIGIQVVMSAVFIATCVAFAADSGSESNPLVSKSYVDDKISQLTAMISSGGDGTSAPTTGTSYEPVYVSVGQTIYGGEGTELILRAGKGNVVISGTDGIVDATTGADLTNGKAVTKNHIMIVPRADNRGVKVTEAAWFLVKGSYTIS
jgi:hypothetical protein